MSSLRRILTAIIFFAVFCLVPNSFSQNIIQNQLPTLNSFSNTTSAGFDPRIINSLMAFSIDVPDGVNKIQPNLTIGYSPSEQNGIFGVGWTLEFDAIERSLKKGPPAYDSSDLYVLVQSGVRYDLVYDIVAGHYRTEIEGSFLKIESSPGYWIATDKQGTKYFFGSTQDARQEDPANGNRRFRWNLDRVEDVHGNYLNVTYTQDNSEVYPSRIDYTGNTNTSLAPFASVEFTLENRAIPYRTYKAGFLVLTNKRISKILVKAAGVLQREYRLTYAQSQATQRDLLFSVQQFGADGTISLPATTFQYNETQRGFDEVNSAGIASTVQFSSAVSGGNIDLGIRIADVNGDVYPDIIKSFADQQGSITRETYLNNKNNTWSLNSSWSTPGTCTNGICSSYIQVRQVQCYGFIHHVDAGMRIADINGDGRNDIAQAVDYINVNNYYVSRPTLNQVFLNTGSGWGGADSAWHVPDRADLMYWFTFANGSCPNLGYAWRYQFLGNIFSDINGDGYADIVTSNDPPDTGGQYNGNGTPEVFKNTYINNLAQGTTGWTQNSSWTPPNTSYTDFSKGADLVDLNGDALPDIFYRTGGTSTVYMNTGSGWQDDTNSPWLNTSGLGDLTDGSTQLADINGDGLVDLIVAKGSISNGSGVLINTGNGWFRDDNWVLPSGDFTNLGTRLWDANADMLLDFIIHYNGNIPRLFLNKTKPADILLSMNNGFGGVTILEYGSSAQFNNTFLPFTIPVITAVTKSNSLGDSYRTTFTYGAGLWVPQKREFRGFGFIKTTDPEGHYTETDYLQDDFKKGKIAEQRTYAATGQLLTKIINTWQTQSLASGVNFVFLKKTDNFVYGLGGSGKRITEEYFYDEAVQLGNLTKTVQYGEVDFNTGADNVGNDKRTAETAYVNNTSGSSHLIGFPRLTTVKNNADQLVRQTWFNYDNHANTDVPTKGLLTQKEEWLSGAAANPIIQFTYNSLGNLLTTKDSLNNTTIIGYDPMGVFPLMTTNAAGHVVSREYYGINGVALSGGLWGELKSTTDQNNQKETRVYDTLGRLTQIISPLDSAPYPTTINEYQFGTNYQKITTRERVKSGQAKTMDTFEFFDGLGRKIQTKKFTAVVNQYAVSGQTKYNSRGLPQDEYWPFFSTNAVDTIESVVTTRPHQTKEYDALGRVTRVTNADGTYATSDYDKWTTIMTDENGHKKESDLDAYGRLAEVREYRGADGRFPSQYPNTTYTLYATTKYFYDSEGNLIQTLDHVQHPTTMAYDTLGRKISLDDPDMNLWVYAYDLNGNLVEQTDAKGQTVQFSYDSLNRLTHKWGPGSLDVVYTYDDSLVNLSKGRLTRVQYLSLDKKDFEYDQLGREIWKVQDIEGTSYPLTTTYNALNQVESTTYPDNSVLQYIYDDAGRIQKINVSNIPPATPPLPAPVLNDPVAGNAQVSLTWSSVSGATGYRLEHKPTSSGTWSQIYDGTQLNYVKTGLTNGVSYDFRVFAYNTSQTSASSAVKSATPQAAPLSAPTLNDPLAGNAQVSLTWSSVSGATAYKLEYKPTAGSTWTVSYDGANLNHIQGSLTNGTSYDFRVLAYNSTQTSPYSTPIKSATPQAPSSGIAFDAASSSQVDNATQMTLSHTVGSNTNRVLVVAVSAKDTTVFPLGMSMSYAGQAMTRIDKKNFISGTNYMGTELWYLLNPPAGTNTVSVSFNSAMDGITMGAVSLTGVQQQAPEVKKTAVGTSATASATLTTLTNNAWVIDSLGIQSGAVITTVGSGQTQRYFQDNSNDIVGAASTKPVATAGSTTLQWNFASSKAWGVVAAAFAPASGGAMLDQEKNIYLANICRDSLPLVGRVREGGDERRILDTRPKSMSKTESWFVQLISWVETVMGVSETYASEQIDYMTFTESDPTSQLAVSASCVVFNNLETRNTSVYLYKSQPTSGDFFYTIDTVLNTSDVFSGETLIWGVSNSATLTYDDWSDGLLLGIYHNGGMFLKLKYVGGTYDTSVQLTKGTRYYVRVSRTGTTLKADIYSDAAMTTLVDTLTKTLSSAVNYQYLYGFSAQTVGSTTKKATGDVCHLTDESAQPPAPPAAPTLNDPVPGDGQVSLSWSTVSGATGYKLEYKLTSSGTWSLAYDGTNVSYIKTGLSNGTSYDFRVYAYNQAGTSSPSAVKSAIPQLAPPSAPTLSNPVPGDGQVSLSWSAVSSATGYKLEYKLTSSGTWSLAYDGTNTAYIKTGLTNGTSYDFRVFAYNQGGTSGPSAVKSATPQFGAPSAPSLNDPVAGDGQVSLNWSTVSNATGYKLEYKLTSGSTWSLAYDGTSTTYIKTGLTNGTSYDFRVFAYNQGGTSSSSSVKSATPNAVTEVPIVDNVIYNAAGQIVRIDYGNGTYTVYDYDLNNLRLTRIRTTDSGGFLVQDLTYAYDGAGNILTITDTVHSATQSFEYDEQNRLVWASSGQYGNQTFDYDVIGNLLSKDGQAYAYGNGTNAGPHAVVSVGSIQTFGYDANGNMTTKTASGQTTDYVYDTENRLSQVKVGSTVLGAYAYDDAGERTKKTAGSTTTHYAGSVYEKKGSETTSYVFLGRQRVASYGSAGLFYYHGDHLGGTNVVTDDSGIKTELSEYKPYGEFSRHDVTSQQPTKHYFTDQYLDDETALYYYGARYYSPLIGRFISADTVVQELGSPQALNRYAYALNNPVNRIDPSGHSAMLLGIDPETLNNFGKGIASLISGVDDFIKGAIPNGVKSFLSGSPEKFDYAFDQNLKAFNTAALIESGAGLFQFGKTAFSSFRLQAPRNILANEVGAINPSSQPILFGQSSVSRIFTTAEQGSTFKYAGMSIKEVSQLLRQGRISVDEIPIEYIRFQGQNVAVNNRSLTALRRANMEPTLMVDVTNNKKVFQDVLNRLDEMGGFPSDTIRIRGTGLTKSSANF